MRFAAALSEHPLASHATGEVVGQVMDTLGERPDLAILFVTAPHADTIQDIAATIRNLLKPTTLLGVTAVSVVGDDREVEQSPAVSLWAGNVGPTTAVQLSAIQTSEGWQLSGIPTGPHSGTFLVLTDPFTFPADVLLRGVEGALPDLTIVGGMASASARPGGNRLIFNDQVLDRGAVGVLLPETAVSTVVSQGCRPVGEPFTITRAENNLILELGGKPAAERLQEMVRGLDETERTLLRSGLHMGLVVNEQKLDFSRGDFLIRGVQGVDADRGAVAIGDHAHVGTTAQFQLRDAATAHEDLRELLRDRTGQSALLFTCNGRGSHLFDEPHHDASMISSALGGVPQAGMFCAGEIGPIGGRNFVHGFTASAVLFD